MCVCVCVGGGGGGGYLCHVFSFLVWPEITERLCHAQSVTGCGFELKFLSITCQPNNPSIELCWIKYVQRKTRGTPRQRAGQSRSHNSVKIGFDGIFQHLSTRDAYMRQWTRSLSIPSTAQWFVYSAKRNSQDRWPLLLTWIDLILARISNHMPSKLWVPARIRNHMPSKVWDEITYPFLNFNGCTVEV